MALVRELEDHGCDLKASILCKYTKQEVQRCNACEYKSMTDEERKQIVIDHYLNEGLLDAYPIEVGNEEGDCALCRKKARKATTQTYAKITNKCMDVRKDLAGSGEKINGGEIAIEIPTCQACKQNIRKTKWLRSLMMVVCVILAFAATAIINISVPQSPDHTGFIPLTVFAGCCLASFGIYYVSVKAILNKIGQQTRVQVFDLPALAPIKDKDWYVRGMNWLKATIYAEMPEDLVDTRVTFSQMVHGDPKKNKRNRKKRALTR